MRMLRGGAATRLAVWLVLALVASISPSVRGQPVSSRPPVLANYPRGQFLRQVLEDMGQDQQALKQELPVDNYSNNNYINNNNNNRPSNGWKENQETPRGYLFMPELDEEGRARRADQELVLKSDTVKQMVEELNQFRRLTEQQQRLRQADRPAARMLRNEDLLAEVLVDALLNDLSRDGKAPLGFVWPQKHPQQRPQQQQQQQEQQPQHLQQQQQRQWLTAGTSADKRFAPATVVGLKFPRKEPQQEVRQQVAEDEVRASARLLSSAAKKPPKEEQEAIIGIESAPTNFGGPAKHNQMFMRPDMVDNLVVSGFDDKRIENSRWNNLRGMWGKRSADTWTTD